MRPIGLALERDRHRDVLRLVRGLALGGWQGGLFFDLCGSYGPSFVNASLGGVANLLVLALLYLVTVHRPRRTAPAVA